MLPADLFASVAVVPKFRASHDQFRPRDPNASSEPPSYSSETYSSTCFHLYFWHQFGVCSSVCVPPPHCIIVKNNPAPCHPVCHNRGVGTRSGRPVPAAALPGSTKQYAACPVMADWEHNASYALRRLPTGSQVGNLRLSYCAPSTVPGTGSRDDP